MNTAVLATLVPLALVVVVLLVLVILVPRRDEPDPDGRRPYAAYVFFVTFLALFTALFALFAFANAAMHLAISDDGSSSEARQTIQLNTRNPVTGEVSSDAGHSSSSSESSDADDAHIRAMVRAGLILLAAAAVLWFHVGLARRLHDEAGFAGGPAWRLYNAYLFATMALAVIVVVAAFVIVGYAIFHLVAPGVASPSGVGKRSRSLPDLVSGLVLGAGAVGIFLYHWQRRVPEAVAVEPPEPLPPPPTADRPRRPMAAKKARRPIRRE